MSSSQDLELPIARAPAAQHTASMEMDLLFGELRVFRARRDSNAAAARSTSFILHSAAHCAAVVKALTLIAPADERDDTKSDVDISVSSVSFPPPWR